ncbi:M15 family metallopeptidase [Sansalvadorimonas verongulae]|uniref:M15 family metallopeptidase n=1 Tax=Sansalvadorimonas verongulae TaxID=2172824 RepID=UPI0012BC031F|nr:M15 family metallopeptidase [Sansalvadorimonas verongulae]MTI13376.1 M15 family peptidase [Sansalvadorimonas verongulae]
MYKWGARSLRRMQGVNHLLTECATRALAKSRYDMTIPWMGGVRSAEEQKNIFDQGASKADGTNNLSYHQSGNALDVEPVGYNREQASNTFLPKARNQFAQLMFNEFSRMKARGEIPENVYLHWGGLWGASGWDPQHFELREL